MNTSDPLKEISDPPLIPSEGVTNIIGRPVERRIYYRSLDVGNGLTMTMDKRSVRLDIAGGAGTVTDVNSMTGSISLVSGNDIAIENTSEIKVSVVSEIGPVPYTIPKRSALGTFDVTGPIDPNNVANKEYVDSVAQNLHIHESVRVIKIASFGTDGVDYNAAGTGVGKTLTNAGVQVALAIDGVAMVVNDRVIVAGDGIHNGIYVVTATGSGLANWVLTRALDADAVTGELVSGSYAFVTAGTSYANSGWVVNTPNVFVVDTDAISFVQFNSAGQVTANNAGAGGLGLFYQKLGNVLQFKNINARSGKVTLTEDTLNHEIDIDVNTSLMNLNDQLGPLFPVKGGTGLTTTIPGNFLISNGLSAFLNNKVAPSGVVLGDTDSQTLTNKTINDASNTVAASHVFAIGGSVAISTLNPTAGQTLVATSPTTAAWQNLVTMVGTTLAAQTQYGFNASATPGIYGTAIGASSSVTGNYGIALGDAAIAFNTETIAIGRNANAQHLRSIVIGNTTSDSVNQFKITPTVTTLRASGLTSVGTGQVVCRNANGDIGPNTNGVVVLPVGSTDPSNVMGGIYFSDTYGAIRVSNGSTWTSLAAITKYSFTGLTSNLGNPNILRSFLKTSCDATNWRYVAKSASGNIRSGEIMAVWNSVTNTITYDERTTMDIGNTSALTMNVDISFGNVRFTATITGVELWTVKFVEEQL